MGFKDWFKRRKPSTDAGLGSGVAGAAVYTDSGDNNDGSAGGSDHGGGDGGSAGGGDGGGGGASN